MSRERQKCFHGSMSVFPSAQLLLSRSNTLLSHSCLIHSATASSSNPSNFQLINNSALKAYQERTKNDLVLRPLTTQLQTYDSPSFVFAVLREQVQAILFQGGDGRWSIWLDRTVNILCFFCDTWSGFWPGMPMPEDMPLKIYAHIFLVGILTCDYNLCLNWRFRSVCILSNLTWAIAANLRMFRLLRQAKTPDAFECTKLFFPDAPRILRPILSMCGALSGWT